MGFFTKNKDKKKKKSVEALLNSSSNNKDNASFNNDVNDTDLLKDDLGIPEFNDKNPYGKNINDLGDNYGFEHQERGSYFEDSLNKRSFDQDSSIRNPLNTLNKNNQNYNLDKIEKEIELLNSKLETIKAMLENITTRIENIEKKNERKMF